jgi:hypothetical protein
MLHFTARNYPKRKNQMDQKKTELAFFKGLRYFLSKKYTYTIVADRSFANSRILEIVKDLKFDYVLRIKENLIVKKAGKYGKFTTLCRPKCIFFTELVSWEKIGTIVVKTANKNTWFLKTNRNGVDIADSYLKRFKIEKRFQDLKVQYSTSRKQKLRIIRG